jgi:hypothetical protein
VTDRYGRILRLVAQQRQRELDGQDTADHGGETPSAGRRRHLKRIAILARGRVVAKADARRHYGRPDSVS